MDIGFMLIAALVSVSGVAAVSFRNLVHCALSLAVCFAGIALLYLNLGAQFIGFAQAIVYIGAVAILIVFAILLTRSSEPDADSIWSSGRRWGIALALAFVVALFGGLSEGLDKTGGRNELTVKEIGHLLMLDYVVPLLAIGVLLTSALLGAVVIAMEDSNEGGNGE